MGKTYAMLQEGHRRKSRGADVVIGFLEAHGRNEIQQMAAGLELVPPLNLRYKGSALRETDVDAIIARAPRVALVDELAHTNAPGSRCEKRYQDVQDLLDAGITVITTLNVEHIESLSEHVKQMTGVEVRETLPDSVIEAADQIELIDLPPEDLIQRMKDGRIYPPDQARVALQNFFTLANLTALRDLALRATAKEVEEKLGTFMDQRKVEGLPIGDRIMIAVDQGPSGKALIRQGCRLAAALKGALIVVHVEPTEDKRKVRSADDQRQLDANLQLADDMGAEVVRLEGKVADQLITYARAHHVSQLFIGHPSHSRWEELLHGSVTAEILRKAPGINVHVIGDRGK